MVKILLKYNADYNNRLYEYKSNWCIDINNKLGESIMGTVIRYRGKKSRIYSYLESLNPVLFYEYD